MMPEKIYDNSTYWVDIHKDFQGSLRAVGWPGLCEEFNRLKYQSEQASFLDFLARTAAREGTITILEIGVGIGFWTAIQMEYFRQNGMASKTTALDISPVALDLVKQKFPEVDAVVADLKSVDVDRYREQYDIVTAIMVLLHLTDFDAYQHALRFCARSVKPGGSFICYDPLLVNNYSPLNSLEYERFSGNSIPRPINLVDNIMANLGLHKVATLSGASWLLNSPIQGSSKLIFRTKQWIWRVLVRLVFRNDGLTRTLSKPLMALDRAFKRGNADSGTFVLYRKI